MVLKKLYRLIFEHILKAEFCIYPIAKEKSYGRISAILRPFVREQVARVIEEVVPLNIGTIEHYV